ncbi:MAG TPA: hypothetical protein DIT48_01860, partial [Actinobacteria bacterium]|nr:hypothetical protein [Actinomycetota bacterium]
MQDARIGTRLRGYRIEQILGRGGMGVVYLAEDVTLKRKVALKVLSNDLAADPAFRERFVRESQLAASLEHPNVLPIYEAGDQDGELFIAMRFVGGSDLRKLLDERGPLEPAQAVRIVRDVAGALDDAHAEGLVHRDVKPANILVASGRGANTTGHVYLSDFGLTKRLESTSGLTRTGQFMGTIDYIAPEQIKGEAVDGRADQYSLGCVLFECLTGRTPFERDPEVAVIYAHLSDPPPSAHALKAGLPAALDPVIARAMAKDPVERFDSCGAFAAAAGATLGATTAPVPTELPVATSGLSAEEAVRRSMSEAILRSVEAGTPIQGDEIERAVNTAVARSIAEKLAGPGAKPPWRPRRAVWLFVAAAIAGVVAFVLLTRHHPHVSTTPTPHPSATAPPVAIPRGVTRIDPVTNRVVTTVQLDDANGKVITGDGFVWVARPEHVAKIEESSDQIVATIPADMVPAVDVGGEVWGRNATTFSRIDVHTNRVTEVSISSIGIGGVTADAGSIWVARGGFPGGAPPAILRIDAASGRLRRTFTLSSGPQTGVAGRDIAVTDGAVWYVDESGGLGRVDIATGAVTTVPTTANGGVAAGDGFLWVLDAEQRTVIQIDPSQESVVHRYRVGAGPGPMAANAQGLWILNHDDGTVSHIDPVQAKVVATIPVGVGPLGIAADGTAVWVVH